MDDGGNLDEIKQSFLGDEHSRRADEDGNVRDVELKSALQGQPFVESEVLRVDWILNYYRAAWFDEPRCHRLIVFRLRGGNQNGSHPTEDALNGHVGPAFPAGHIRMKGQTIGLID